MAMGRSKGLVEIANADPVIGLEPDAAENRGFLIGVHDDISPLDFIIYTTCYCRGRSHFAKAILLPSQLLFPTRYSLSA